VQLEIEANCKAIIQGQSAELEANKCQQKLEDENKELKNSFMI
jgi:hypothetical protein